VIRRSRRSALPALALAPLLVFAAAIRSAAADEPPDAPLPETAQAGHGRFGLGVLLGQPVGISMKLFVAPNHAFQLGLGYDLVLRDAGTVTLDYVWHPIPMASTRTLVLTWHIGLGGSLGVWPAGHDYDCRDGDLVTPGIQPVCRTAWVQPGVRAPLGFEVVLRDVPLELYAEFAPGVLVYPMIEFLAQGGFGVRWYF
jgi:hypothetical protein